MVITEKKVMKVEVNGISSIDSTIGKITCVMIPCNAGMKIPAAINQACNLLDLFLRIFNACLAKTTTAPMIMTDIQYRSNSSRIPALGVLLQPQVGVRKNSECLLLATYNTSKMMNGPYMMNSAKREYSFFS